MQERTIVMASLWLVVLILVIGSASSATEPGAAGPGCTTSSDGKNVDGSTLWEEVPKGEFAIDCEFQQFGWNNFLYLVSDDGTGHPRFMSFAPWYDALPANGAPKWPGKYSPLSGTQLHEAKNETQSGDNFQLMDVAQGVTAFDIRINQTYFNYIHQNHLYTQKALDAFSAAYKADPGNGGIWLPPNRTNHKNSIEIKTAWRDFGKTERACPSNIMHCETDTLGYQWGLVGLLLVQKTQQHGEFIWTVFEHVANVPDCAAGASTPIAQEPANPLGAGTINVNKNLGSIAQRTGWNYFDYQTYRTQGGNGSTCGFPNGTHFPSGHCGSPTATPLCNTNPNRTGGGFLQVNICRTDAVPALAGSCVSPDQSNPEHSSKNVACLNDSVLNHFPRGLADKWKYYRMIGSEWGYDGASNFGASGVGCFSITKPPGKSSFTCPQPASHDLGESASIQRRGNPYLASAVTETWLQKEMCLPKSNTDSSVLTHAQDCFSCHQPQTKTWGEGDMSHLFGRITQAGSVDMAPSH